MANHKSAKKRSRQTETITTRTSAARSRVRTLEKKVAGAIQSKEAKTASELLIKFSSIIDKAAQKGVVAKQRASRRIASLSRQISALK